MSVTTKRVRDLCGLYCPAELADYKQAEFFVYLIGTGVSRSLYQLTAQDRDSGAELFDMQIEAEARALQFRAHKAGTATEDQAVRVALEHARRIVDAADFPPGAHFQLQVEAGVIKLNQIEHL